MNMRKTAYLLALATLLPNMAMAATQAELDALYAKGTIPFRDIDPASEFLTHIVKLKELKLTTGTGNGLFEPERCVSKSEVVKFALDAAGVPVATSATTPFTDLSTTWQKNYVETARAKGFLPETDYAFMPNECATRIFSTIVILRAAKVTTPAVASTPFTDVIYADHVNVVEYARGKGILSGRNATTFAPYGTTLRKEMAKILMNTYTIVLHPDSGVGNTDRLPDLDTAVRMQTVLDNFAAILSSNAIATTGTTTVTRFAFVSPQFHYVDYTDGTLKRRLLLDMTKPDENFRIAVVAAFTADENGVLKVVTGTDTQKDKTTTVYLKEGTAWLRQATVDATTQLFANTAFNYTITVPKSWFFWNRGKVGTDDSLVDFAKAAVSDTNVILRVRIVPTNLAATLTANNTHTAEDTLANGKLRTYADGTFKAIMPRNDSTKTFIFETKGADVTKEQLVTIVNSLKEVAI